MTPPARILAVGFDATPAHLVFPWAEQGKLPVLGRLMREGARTELRSLSYDIPENNWPTWATGCGPGSHGIYDWRAPRPGSYARVRNPPRSRRLPFWRLLQGEAGPPGGAPRTLLLDVPYAGFEREPGSVQVVGWGQRGAQMNVSWPESLLSEINAKHGTYADSFNREAAGRPLISRSQLRTILRMTAKRTDVLVDLMRSHPWELCATTYFEPHFAGHAFHAYAAPERYAAIGAPVRFARGLEDALLRCYQATDAALGRVIAAAPEGTHIAVHSGVGLRPNTSGVAILPRLLDALGYRAPRPVAASTRARERAQRLAMAVVPRPVLRKARSLLAPTSMYDHSVRIWMEEVDWSAARAWTEGEPGWGYIRINVRGREPQGTVDPDDYRSLCDEIAAELMMLEIVETGEPAVESVVHRDDLVGPDPDSPLPDLVVRWARTQVIKRVRHPVAGIVEDDMKDFRATEHDDDGWLVLAGPQVRAGVDIGEAQLTDVAPTLIHLMGGAVPDAMDGRALTEMLVPELGEVRTAAVPLADPAWEAAVSASELTEAEV